MVSENHTQNAQGEPPAVARLRHFYEQFGVDALSEIPAVYSDGVVFQDPTHRIEGLPALQRYFARTTQNITECRFEFQGVHLPPGASAWIEWQMHYAHPRLSGGATLSLEGVTHVQFDERITYHRDYFDLGAMLYEHVPVLGGAVRWLKNRMSG